jgi:hypothetical protein
VVVPAQASTAGDVCGVVAFVLSIPALLTICVWFISGPLSVAAIIVGVFGLRSRLRGLAIAGIVIGTLALLGVITFYGFLFAMVLYSDR